MRPTSNKVGEMFVCPEMFDDVCQIKVVSNQQKDGNLLTKFKVSIGSVVRVVIDHSILNHKNTVSR